MRPELLITCEHGGNRVPERLGPQFGGASRVLASHQGWDAGALVLAKQLARKFHAPLSACTTSRLVVDTNRSLDNAGLFSKWTRRLPNAERADIIEAWWQPHRTEVEEFVLRHTKKRRPVLHLSIHSFTPRWKGRARAVDIGFLCDPARAREVEFVERWRAALAPRAPRLRLRRNQPYRGTTDGFTSSLRSRFAGSLYIGVELEVSQRFPLGDAARWRDLRSAITRALAEALD